jgi:DNA repair protein RadD
MLTLRPYQSAARDALFAYWANNGGNGLIVLPTGAGKTIVLASICQQILEQYPTMRLGVITHVRELIDQNEKGLLRLWPEAPAGVYSAGLKRRDAQAQILFMGIQSVHKKAADLGGFDLLLIDEAHTVGRSANSMYGKFIADCRSIVPDMRICGLSATPFRLTTGYLHKGKDALFSDIVYEASVADLIEQGYLSNLVAKSTPTQIDTAGLHIRGGEYIQAELDERACIPEVVASAAKEIVQRGQDRAGWAIFCTGVNHAEQVRDAIRAYGISCETVIGDTPSHERDEIIRAFKAKEIRCLTSVGVLTTGFDAPHIDLIAFLRPTMSPGLYLQMAGRGLRLAPGKKDCLLLDMAGVVRQHGPIDDVVVPKDKRNKSKDQTVRAKACPECETLVALNVFECPECGYAWPKDERPKHDGAPDEDIEIFSREANKDRWRDVTSIQASVHHKDGSPDSLKLTYWCGMFAFNQWVTLWHNGFAGTKARMWLRRIDSGLEHEMSAACYDAEMMAVMFNYRQPKIYQILTKRDGKYQTVIGWRVVYDAQRYEVLDVDGKFVVTRITNDEAAA